MTTSNNGKTPAALTPETAQHISRIATACVAVVGLTAAGLSWEGLHRLALTAGVDSRLAWGLPVIVDGTVLAGLLGVLAGTLAGTGTRFPWLLVALGAFASVAGNVAAAPATTVGRTVAIIAPVCLALSLEQGLRILRHRAGLPAPRNRRQRTTPAVDAGSLPVAVTSPVASPVAPPGSPARPARKPSSAAPATVRTGSRRAQVAALLANDAQVTGAAVAQTLGIDPADARRHLRALRSEPQSPRATLTLATAAGGA